MIYLDNAATTRQKPPCVAEAVVAALSRCGNSGRGVHEDALAASRTVYNTRERIGRLFSCRPEQVILTTSCTHGLNLAIHSLIRPGSRVAVSGFEHNAVTRPLHALGAD